MAEHTINSKIKIRKDTSDNWTSKNPILLDGELGFDSTNNMFKMGNGVYAWNDMPYISNSEILKTIFTIPSSDIQYLLWVRDANDSFTYVYKRDDVYIDKNGCLNDIRGIVASKSDIPTNYMTTNTDQLVGGVKSFLEIPKYVQTENILLPNGATFPQQTIHSLLYERNKRIKWDGFSTSTGSQYIYEIGENFTVVMGSTTCTSTAKTVNFDYPFKEGCYVVGSSNARLSISCYDFTKAGFTVRSDSSNSYNFYYIAIGK